ncbi:DUF6397 family protein [Streptomyces sp. NPDC012769]|uniref:DUF6397 family protein n=1 Tax=Streptomyces sp. NPDC012769 TaxID=3364848 RepID=UPI0036808BEB
MTMDATTEKTETETGTEPEDGGTVAPGRAAQELGLRRDEFQLAVHLGLVRTMPGPGPGRGQGQGAGLVLGRAGTGRGFGTGARAADLSGDAARRRVARSEIARLRAAPDFPDGLRDRVRAVGATEGARLLSVTMDRFARLAKTGHFSPVRFYVNRYKAVVWLYPAAELSEFALTHPGLLSGRLALDIRTRSDAGEDWRPRNWRARRLGILLRADDDPWARTAAIASLLAPAQLAEVVDDPFERAYLDRLRPAPPSWRPSAPAAREIADRLLLADDPDEILWHRMSLALALDEARAERQAPRPGITTPRAMPATPLLPPRPAAPLVSSRPAAPAVRTEAALPASGGRAAAPWPGPAGPARPAAVTRPPGRRIRRGLLDRLRRRKEAAPR